MTYGEYGLSALQELPGEGHSLVVGPEVVRRMPSGYEKGVEIGRRGIRYGFVDPHSRGFFLAGDFLSLFEPHVNQLVSFFSECLCRAGVFHIFEHVIHDYGDFRHGASFFPPAPAS